MGLGCSVKILPPPPSSPSPKNGWIKMWLDKNMAGSKYGWFIIWLVHHMAGSKYGWFKIWAHGPGPIGPIRVLARVNRAP